MGSRAFEKKSHGVLILTLVIIAYFFLMFGNNMVSLTHPDEVFYIQSAKEMVKHNSWLTPMIFDDIQFEKPILGFALMAAAIKFFGMTPFVARFWPAFFGILGVCAAYWIAWMLFHKKRLAFIAGLILSTSIIYVCLSRAVLTDMIFSVFVVISMGCFYQAVKEPKCKSSGIIFSFVFMGFAVMTKGLLGFLFPMGAAAGYLFYKKDFGFLKSWSVLWGLLIFLAISLPWHILMFKWYGNFFIEEYFGNVHLGRVFRAEHPKLDNWYFYIVLMFAGVMPWTLLMFPSVVSVFNVFKQKTKERKVLAFLLFWILSVYIFTQPAHSKLASYIFPVFPAIAIIIARYLERMLVRFERGEPFGSLVLCSRIMAGILFVVAIGIIIFARINIAVTVNMTSIYIFSVMVTLVAILMLVFSAKKKVYWLVLTFPCVTAAVLTMLFLGRPYAEPWVSCEQVSQRFMEIDNSDSVVLASKFYVRGVRYYTDRTMAVININGHGFFSPHPIPFLNTDKQVLDFLNSQVVTYAVVKEGDVDDLKRIVKKQPFKLDNLGGDGGKFILRIEKIDISSLSVPGEVLGR